jgi:hypothetical protein
LPRSADKEKYLCRDQIGTGKASGFIFFAGRQRAGKPFIVAGDEEGIRTDPGQPSQPEQRISKDAFYVKRL